MGNKYNWGIYNPVGSKYDFKNKERNVENKVRYFLNKTVSMFEYENLPETIPAYILEKQIQTNGYVAIIENDSELYALNGALGGEMGIYGEPTEIVISNPKLKLNNNYKIDDDVIIIKNDYLNMGLIPLFSQYADMMNENEITMILSNVNRRVDNIISVADDNTAESARLYLENIYKGNLGYIFENKLFESLKSNPTSNQGSANMIHLIEYQQYLKSTVLNEIGLDSNHNMKKERMITDEIKVDSDSIYALVDSMLECRINGIKKVNDKFGTNISVQFGGSWKHRNKEEIIGIEEPINESEETEEIEEIEEPINESEETRLSIEEIEKDIENYNELDMEKEDDE